MCCSARCQTHQSNPFRSNEMQELWTKTGKDIQNRKSQTKQENSYQKRKPLEHIPLPFCTTWRRAQIAPRTKRPNAGAAGERRKIKWRKKKNKIKEWSSGVSGSCFLFLFISFFPKQRHQKSKKRKKEYSRDKWLATNQNMKKWQPHQPSMVPILHANGWWHM